MSAVPNIKSHFASSNVTTPGFAVGGASASNNNNNVGGGHANGTNSPSIVPATTSNFFTNATSSYQSHFGDFSSNGVNIARSASNTSAVSGSVGVVGGGVPPSAIGTGAKSPHTLPMPAGVAGESGGSTTSNSNTNSTNNNNNTSSPTATASAPAPIGTAPLPIAVGAGNSKGSPCSAPLPISSGLRSSPTSHSNSPHTLSLTPTVKFASPMAVGTSPKTASALAAGGVMSGGELKDGAGGVNAVIEPRKTLSTPNSLNANSANNNSNNIHLGTNLAPTSTNSPTGKPTTKAANEALVQAEMDEEVLNDAHKYAMLALSTASANNNNGGMGGGVSLSPTSPCGLHSGTPSPTSTTPRVDLMNLSPTSSMQLSAQHMQQQQQQQQMYNSAAAAPLTPLSAQSSSSRHSNPTPREPVVNVYDSDFKTLLSIPASQVVHRPHPSLGVSRLVLCRNYLPENPSNCSKGELCKFVHADVSNASRCSIHVNYAWRSLEVCAYPRLPAGDELTVLAPNERPPSEVIASERILVTRGSTNWREHTAPLSHCAHYYFNRMCNRGERCNFIHAVHVDPNVQGDFKRAPAPTAVAPIVSKSPTSPALRGAPGGSPSSGTAALPPPPPPPLPTQAQPQPLQPQPQPPQCSAFGFVSNVYTPPPPPPPPGPMGGGYPLAANSPTGGSGAYMMFSNGGAAAATGFVPATLVPPPPSHLGNSNGIYLLVPAHPGMSATGGTSPVSPVSPLGQSLGSLSNGPIDWSFYGDLETSAWMPPPSPSGRM